MKQKQEITVEFIGGPFDGYQQPLSGSNEDLAETVALPVNDNVFLMLDGKHRGPVRPSRTVALYELCGDGSCRYRFIRSRKAAELNLGHWQV